MRTLGFWFQAVFAFLNLYMFFTTPLDFASPFNFVIGIWLAVAAYQLKDYAFTNSP